MLVNRRVVFLAVMTALAGAVFAQTGVSLEAEIQNLEKAANGQGVSPSERHDALAALARLRQLSGDIEGAARNWLDAAAAIPGQIDDDALLACAYCLAAMGELDRARTALEPLLIKSARARFLYSGINAISTGNTSALITIADIGEYSQMKSEIYFLLWRTLRANGDSASAEKWRERLVAEFPQSPEGRLASGGASDVVAIKPGPFWLLIGGLDSLPLLGSETIGRPVTPAASPQAVNVSAAQTAVSPSQNASVSQTSVSSVKLQTGLFSRQANAQAQVEGLTQAGFSPSIEQRGEMWVVTVSAGADTNRAIKELKDAGFDSFPLR
jgi:tetratricopeptide (TPR) repeat protein